jgi:hypothetical protein
MLAACRRLGFSIAPQAQDLMPLAAIDLAAEQVTATQET